MRISDWSSDVCSSDLAAPQVHYRSALIEGVEIAYREAGDPARPAVLLLHGFPTSSHMFRELIPALAERYHVLAPDYPGSGASRSEEHTSELQSLMRISYAVFCLKKKIINYHHLYNIFLHS